MKLYYEDVLSPRKACAVARYLNSPVEYVRVDLGKSEHKTPAYLAINPNGKVPTLADGDFALWEANAILVYLAQKAGSDLWPSGAARQADIVRWFSWEMDHFNRAAGALYFEFIVKPRYDVGALDRGAVGAATADFRAFARVLDDHLAGRKFLVGEALTVADFAVGITLPYADAAHIPLGDFTNIQRWHDRLNALPAWRDPWPQPARDAA